MAPFTWRRAVLLPAALALLVGAAACGGTTKSGTSAGGGGSNTASAKPGASLKEGLNVALLPKQINNPYFDTASKGADKAVTALKGKYKYTGPSDASASSQVS